MQELLAYLASVPAGLIADTATLEVLLASCWKQFEGSNAEGMAGYKLRGRMEDVVWHPPSLRFMIERHGATVLGSTRAARQEWNINIETLILKHTQPVAGMLAINKLGRGKPDWTYDRAPKRSSV